MATAVQGPPQSATEQAIQGGTAPQGKSEDPNIDSPQTETGEQAQQKAGLSEEQKKALLQVRKVFKDRYLPKRMRYVSEGMRAFEALRGNTYALLNDQASGLDTINQLMQGYLGTGADPQLYAHNDNIYQAFCLIFIAALMVDLGKVRYMPSDTNEEPDIEIAKKGSTIQAYNERRNDSRALQQIQLLFLWLNGCYFRYTRYVIDKVDAGTSTVPQYAMKPTKIAPDAYRCPNCGQNTPDTAATALSGTPQCQNCNTPLGQKDWYEGPMLDLPVQVGEIEVANGMTKMSIVNCLAVDANPDAMELRETDILDYTIEVAPSKVRAAYPNMYKEISAAAGTIGASDGDMSAMARQEMTTPGSNTPPITTLGLVTYSRCWIQPDAFYELEDEEMAKSLVALFPKGCKLVLCGAETFLDAQNESLLDRWTWCGTIRGVGLYPFAAGKVVLDVQERLTGAINKIDAYMDRVAFGTMLYDADYIDGNAMANKVLTPGNLTPVARTDEETGQRVPLEQLFHQMTFQIDAEIYKYPDTLTTRAQFLAGVMPQVFGGSDAHVETAEGQQQALQTALGRLKQYLNQIRREDADSARLSVKTSIDNMDEEVRIIEAGEDEQTWKVVRLLRAELTDDFFTYPQDDEGFPESFAEVQTRIMQLLQENQKMPFVANLLADPDVARVVARYVLPDEIRLPEDSQIAKIKTVIHRLAQDPNGALLKPNPAGPNAPPVVLPSIQPEPNVDDPAICQTIAKKWLLENWEQKDTNPKGYGNVLAYLTLSAQMAKEQQAAAALTMASQQAAGEKRGAGQGAPAQPGQ